MQEHIDPPKSRRRSIRSLLPKLLLVSAYFWIPALLFLYLANQVRTNGPLPGDVTILHAVRTLSSPFMDKFMVAVTTLGSAAVVVPGLALAVGILAYKHRRREALYLFFCAGGATAINIGFKHLFHRDRPTLWQHIVSEYGYSFPSGHSMVSIALALSVIVLCWNTRYRWLAVVAGSVYFILIGLSRMYLGVHYPSDVYGGWSVSILWVLTVYYAFKRFGRRQPAEQSDK